MPERDDRPVLRPGAAAVRSSVSGRRGDEDENLADPTVLDPDDVTAGDHGWSALGAEAPGAGAQPAVDLGLAEGLEHEAGCAVEQCPDVLVERLRAVDGLGTEVQDDVGGVQLCDGGGSRGGVPFAEDAENVADDQVLDGGTGHGGLLVVVFPATPLHDR